METQEVSTGEAEAPADLFSRGPRLIKTGSRDPAAYDSSFLAKVRTSLFRGGFPNGFYSTW